MNHEIKDSNSLRCTCGCIEKAIAVQQAIQQNNPPASKAWQDASVEIHRLANIITSGKTRDAWGR
jgi:hypothetical protein